MSMPKVMTEEQSFSEPTGVIYEFPRSEEIVIHRSDLQIQLEKFKTRVRSGLSIFDFLAVISLWSPVLTADFRSLFGLSADSVMVGYVVFAILVTVFIFYTRCKYWILGRQDGTSSGAEEMSKRILEKCEKGKK